MPDYVASRAVRALNRRGLAMTKARILVLGLAYKRNSGDARESPAAGLIDRLSRDGANVVAADPHIVEDLPALADVHRVELCREELEKADLVVLVTDHDAFDYDLVAAHAVHVLDTRHRLEGEHVEHI
jgi:UDP-N-acetyl-D-glucosamine dehydrogenase